MSLFNERSQNGSSRTKFESSWQALSVTSPQCSDVKSENTTRFNRISYIRGVGYLQTLEIIGHK